VNIPEFESDGSYSLVIRPNHKPVMAKSSGIKAGSLNLIEVLNMKRKNIVRKVGAGLGLTGLGIGSASAALPAGVSSALTAAGTDGGEAATAVLLAIVAIFAIKLLRRAL
jgi:coat protein B